jgi:hypothetical protein
MNNFRLLIFIVSAFLLTNTSKAQVTKVKDSTKNRVDFLILGNRSLLNFIYNRKIIDKKKTAFLINSGFGIVPGSHDKDTIPALLHLIIGASNEFGSGLNKAFAGLSYSTILKLGQDKINSETKNGANGLIAEIGYARYFPKSEGVLRIMFTPILIGKEYRKFEAFPFGLSYGLTF